MNYKLNRTGFSLPEVMMATGILAVGLIMIAGTFPVAIFLTSESVEQSIAPVVADEAFAKIQLYLDPNLGVKQSLAQINNDDSLYPSDNKIPEFNRQYSWTFIYRQFNAGQLINVVVFVSRKTGNGLSYYYTDANSTLRSDGAYPGMAKFTVIATANSSIVTIPYDASVNGAQQKFIIDGCRFVSDNSGTVYRVLQHYKTAAGDLDVVLDKIWTRTDPAGPQDAWIVPPPVTGGRNPCIGVYQRIIKF